MTTIDPVAAAIAAAQQTAAATPAVQHSQVTDVAVAGNTAVGAVAPKGAPLSMETLMMGSMSVDGWLKPKEYGLAVGDNPALFTSAKVYLDMTDGSGFISKMAIKGGNPAQYAYTTDLVTAMGGGTWEAAQARIRALDPKASPYRAVDLPFTVAVDIVAVPMGAPAGTPGIVLAKAGQKLGYTTSTTNWANWEAFYREVVQAGLVGKKVELTIGSQRRQNKNNNVWGVMTFALVGEVVAEETE
jgi:hypothetical protein